MDEVKSRSYNRMIRALIPPVVSNYIVFQRSSYLGAYSSFDEALKHCNGKSRIHAISGIKNRFYEWYQQTEHKKTEEDTDHQLLSAFHVVSRLLHKDDLSVLDTSGMFGSRYSSLRDVIQQEWLTKWDIEESKNVVKDAVKLKINDQSKLSSAEIHSSSDYDAVFCGGTLQFLPDPEAAILQIAEKAHKYLLLSCVPFIEDDEDRLTIPRVKYKGSYPVWFFSRHKWEEFLKREYEIKYRWYTKSEVFLGNNKIPYHGLLLKKLY